MKYGYARVSTAQQKKDGNSLEEQCNQLRQEGCDFIVEEQFTGARMDRPKFQRLCSLLEKGTRWWCASSIGLPERWWRELPPVGS